LPFRLQKARRRFHVLHRHHGRLLQTFSKRGGAILALMRRPNFRPALVAVAIAALALAACENPQKKREEELAKNTFACQLNGERFVVRFAEGEARVLLPGAQRVTSELQLIMDNVLTPLRDCEPYAVMPAPAK